MTVRLGNGAAEVVIHGDQAAELRRVLELVTGGASSLLAAEVTELRKQAESAWPVGKRRPDNGKPRSVPHSAEMFDSGLRMRSDADGPYLSGFIANSAAWTFYVRSNQVGGGEGKKHAWTHLVRRPFERNNDFVAALGKRVGLALREG
jgi:hypothetical protein